MKWLVGAACVAIIASSAVYLDGAYTAYAAVKEQQRMTAIAAEQEASLAAYRECRMTVSDSVGPGYPGTNIKTVSTAVLAGDRCILKYPELGDSYPGSALQTAQMRERVRQLRAVSKD
ncbi:hypothetical protein EOA32_03215 [Mesorhizobium sp. M1A.F.Ca.ET.072.01.1.1]|uniref:hypothetical protein n=1 Tax=Mesorhizobium sp. M1A.F.Ca.ET.072.01.1.1 TaxID=2496753 RepID=UPI000FD55940|nr:hypothetical protein [Mesorhizobium sp. M1A.F.Ca.ET.072.01.1.1]RUW55046.1 hypothetical protein EOA32_03215 [Mesorhizobium sp. M1A.F.Ca.ET.072.01.1.1]TIV04717.1 MAG: hypothetical protein E5W04_02195 [Mesorhizobium sp.]